RFLDRVVAVEACVDDFDGLSPALFQQLTEAFREGLVIRDALSERQRVTEYEDSKGVWALRYRVFFRAANPLRARSKPRAEVARIDVGLELVDEVRVGAEV